MNGLAYSPAGALFCVEGTVYPGAPFPPSWISGDNNGYWCGFASGVVGAVCNAQDGLWASPTFGYPAKTTPMWPSVQTGRVNLGLCVGQFADQYHQSHGNSYDGMVLNFSAWSQGVMALIEWFRNDVLPVGAPQHYLLPYIYRMYCFGDPFRCPGIAHGNELAGMPAPGKIDGVTSGGIAGPLNYTVEIANLKAPDGAWLIYSFANPNDLYAYAPSGDSPWTTQPSAGSVEYLFFQIIMQPSAALFLKLTKLIGSPIGDIQALANVIKFFGAGNNAGHFQYGQAMVAAANDCVALGKSLPHASGF